MENLGIGWLNGSGSLHFTFQVCCQLVSPPQCYVNLGFYNGFSLVKNSNSHYLNDWEVKQWEQNSWMDCLMPSWDKTLCQDTVWSSLYVWEGRIITLCKPVFLMAVLTGQERERSKCHPSPAHITGNFCISLFCLSQEMHCRWIIVTWWQHQHLIKVLSQGWLNAGWSEVTWR